MKKEEEINEVLEEVQRTPKNADDDSDHTIAEAYTPFPEITEDMSLSLDLRI